MIALELHQELRLKYNPDDSQLRSLQLRMLEIIKYFDSFCSEHNIKYWLSCGSCLGAVRHSGFIPWDDDMDIEMLREDFEKLISLRKSFNNDSFIIQDFYSDKEYITPFAKIRDLHSQVKEVHNRDKYFKYKGVFIDIFIREKGSFLTTRLSHIAQYGSYQLTNINWKPLRKSIKRILFSFMNKCIFPALNLCVRVFINNSLLSFNLGCGFYSQIDSEGLLPLKRMDFEGIKLPVPGNYEDYLTRIYGDYMKLPENVVDHRVHFKSILLE